MNAPGKRSIHGPRRVFFVLPLLAVFAVCVYLSLTTRTSTLATLPQPTPHSPTTLVELELELEHQRIFPNRLEIIYHIGTNRPSWWFRPTWKCPSLELIGDNPITPDGPKWTCVDEVDRSSDCLIYSAGIDGEVQWDVAMRQRFPNCELHAFELESQPHPPTLQQLTAVNAHPHYGVSFNDLDQIMASLGHTGRKLSVLKVDIEGDEFMFWDKLFASYNATTQRLSDRISQILMEVHWRPSVSLDDWKPEEKAKIHRLLSGLEAHGFRLCAYEANLHAATEATWVSNHGADRLLKGQ